jgi:hypothetical protein
MNERAMLTLTARDELLAGAPIHLQVISSGQRRVQTEIVRIGIPHPLQLPGGTYAVRALLPSGDVAEHGMVVSGEGPSPAVSVALGSHLAHSWLEPAAILSPPARTRFGDLTDAEFSTAWIRLWAYRSNKWNVVEWPHPTAHRSPHGVRFTFRTLDAVPHAIQVGTASTAWQIICLPLTSDPVITVRPVDRPLHLAVSALSGDTNMDTLLGYLALGDTAAAKLIGKPLTDDTYACHSHFRTAGLGYYLLDSHADNGALRPDLLLTASGTPDGSILSAWTLLERMRAGVTEQSAEEVCLAFVRSASTGMPVFTQGMAKLIDGLRLAASLPSPHQKTARELRVEYARYLAHADVASPLLAFHGSSPDAPGQWIPGTTDIPLGAVLLTTPPPDMASPVPTERAGKSLPGDLVARVTTILDTGLDWRMPVKSWDEVAECVAVLQRALSSSEWDIFAGAAENLHLLFRPRSESAKAVQAPGPARNAMHKLLERCCVLIGRRSVELLRPSLQLGSTQHPPLVASEPSGVPANNKAVSLYAAAAEAQDSELLVTCVSQFRELLDSIQGADLLRPTVLVNYAIALWTLNEWTEELSSHGNPLSPLKEAVSLTEPATEAFQRRLTCLHAVRTMHLEGQDDLTPDNAMPGRAKVVAPETPAAGEPLELRLELTTTSPEPTGNVSPSPQRPSWAEEGVQPAGAQPSPASRRSYIRRMRELLPRYDYEHYSRLAGPLTQPAQDRRYRVQYRSLLALEPHRVRAALMLGAAPLLSFVLVAWLLQPEHWASALNADGWNRALRISMVGAIALIEGIRAIGVLSIAASTLVARDPVPVVPKPGLKVAFLTTCVPGKEPLEMVRATLEAAVRIRHRGPLHVWLLDEGDDPELRLLCERLGVHHFSRKGVPRWNQRSGPNRTQSKHGNYNAWLEAHGDGYDFLASVDTDHIPLPNYLERMLGYFRDEDVAFVASPQVYGNNDSWITRAAESQQYLFHALTQRAGNRYGTPMLVGTNNAIRIKTLKRIGGFRDSITEDLATSLTIHRSRNPDTGRRWRSVYTPDVLAVGEGPNNWTDYFTQQLRWSRGNYEAIAKQLPASLISLSPGPLFHYVMMLAFYPLMALNWVLSAMSCFILVWLGTGSVDIDPNVWLMLYGNASALQIGLYIWNRRHNVSPHEPEGSGGVAGMAMSVMASPVYLRAALDTLLRRSSRFVVTPKGDSASKDTVSTFKQHLAWAALFGSTAVCGVLQSETAGTVGAVWSLLGLISSILAPTLWITMRYRSSRAIRQHRVETKAEPFGPNAHAAGTTETPAQPAGHTRSGRQRA